MKDENYDQEEACRFFEEFANEVFSDCHMAPLNEKYQLDSFFLLLFDQENMYTLSELIEVVKQEEQGEFIKPTALSVVDGAVGFFSFYERKNERLRYPKKMKKTITVQGYADR